MNWYEELPQDCPPETALSPASVYFRLGSIPPSDSDFWSHRRRFPDKVFKASECIVRSLSVYDDLEAAKETQRLIPNLRSKPVFQIVLTEKDGVVLQTGDDRHHFSWWRSTEFDLSTIQIIEP